MKAVTKIVFLDENGEKFFGEGPARLLRAVEETGSLRSAAMSMGMAYTKALKILGNSEKALGFHLTECAIGGKDGGGSRLTQRGKAWLERYEAYRAACLRANADLYKEYFSSKIGCVIMASGMGKRFGGNKLTARFGGKEMIHWIMDATEGLFERRIVVTRHQEVRRIAKERNIEALLHDFPLRSDAVRLGIGEMDGMDGCMFCPSDQPLLKKESIAAMIEAFDGEHIIRAAWDDQPGAPMLFPKWAFEELSKLEAGKGGGTIAGKYPDKVRMARVQEVYELMDVDAPADLERLSAYIK